MSLKFCANLSFMFQESSSILERYLSAKRCGFKGVEYAFPYCDHISSVVDAKSQAGVEQILINVPQGDASLGELGHAALPEKKTVFEENIKLSIEYAKALSCKRVHIMSGKVVQPTSLNMTTYVENLTYAANLMEKEGIVALIEPINNITVPHYFMNSYKTALDVVKTVNSPNLKIMMDLFHLQIIHGNLTNNIKDYLPYVGHIQIAQVPNRNEPNTPGEMNFPYIFSLLKDLKYDGWIGLEYKPLTNTVNGLSWIQEYGIVL
ncbi:putative hydroxypyruvate isomerase [Ischnura elegans]|uniref:putative hydroxypyruvate isomerase n=1 Tax=Ischnura elegans TaxID=197161 RepID=UPI001ED8B9F5|nr:putative hydroxypyruvate isomerase [Ischnura elegans]